MQNASDNDNDSSLLKWMTLLIVNTQSILLQRIAIKFVIIPMSKLEKMPG